MEWEFEIELFLDVFMVDTPLLGDGWSVAEFGFYSRFTPPSPTTRGTLGLLLYNGY